MDSLAGGPQSLRSAKGPFPGGKGLAWIVAAIASVAASVVAAVLTVALAATVVVVALIGGVLLALAGVAMRARRTARARAAAGPQVLEARHLGGHSWVAYGWDRQP